MRKFFVLPACVFLVLSFVCSSFASSNLPENKKTVLGLYITAKEVFAKWQANPDSMNIVDVRTPEEFIFVGHAPMAVNIPIEFLKQSWDPEKKRPVMEINPSFILDVKKKFKITDTLFIMCRSGNRSAIAVNILAAAGFKETYNIIDGFEGDMVKDKGSPYNVRRMVNGWKNSEAPWTYKLKPELMYVPGNK